MPAKKRTRPAPKPATKKPAAKRELTQAPKPRPTQLELLERLSNAVAVSGDEGAVRKIVLEALDGHVDEVHVDALGNVLATKKGRGRFRLMLAAHMDEVGFMVTSAESDGTFRVESVGGVDERHWLGKAVWVGRERTPGMIGAKPIHLLKGNERTTPVKVDALRLDVGASNREAAGQSVRVGDRGTFATPFAALGPVVRGKALDDRLGVAILIELLQGERVDVELVAAFTVQEEVGLRGARVAGYALQPDAAIALDCTPANDLPAWDGSENVSYNTKLGQGPAIYLADRQTISDQALVRHLTRTAEAAGIPFQIRQPGGGGTDAGAIQLAKKGVAVASISVPGRYTHTAAGLASVDDWRNCVRLVRAALEKLTSRTLKR